MTKVIMQVSIAGLDFSYYPGQPAEIDDELAKKWIAVGHCKLDTGGANNGAGDNNGADVGNATGNKAPKQANATSNRTADSGTGKAAPKN